MTRWLVAILIFFAAFWVFLRGAYPSVSVGDSGEFVTSSRTLGIVHPPGYPTYTLTARVFQTCIPWGNAAYRTNLFSAFCASIAAAGLFVICRLLSVSWPFSVVAALLVVAAPAMLANAQASEVFALHALALVAVLWSAAAGRWLLAAFLLGVGLGNHQTLIFIAPVLGLVWRDARPGRSPVGLLGMTLVGFSINAFLIIRAVQAPLLNIGTPDNLHNFWRVLTRADYGTLTLALGEAPARDWYSTGRHFMRFASGLADQLGPLGIALTTLGVLVGLFRRVRWASALLIGFLLTGPLFYLLGNLPFNAQSLGLLERFYIAPLIYWILLAALGLDLLLRRWIYWNWIWLAVPLVLFVTSQRAAAYRYDFRAISYGQNNLRTLPRGATLIMDGGDDTFYTLAYLLYVQGERPDVSIHDRGGVVFAGLYGKDFRLLSSAEKALRRTHVERALISSGHPIAFSTMNEALVPGESLRSAGILYQAGALPHGSADYWALYDLRDIAPWGRWSKPVIPDYRSRALVPFYAYQRSVALEKEGQPDQALLFAQSAHAQGPDVIWLKPNLRHHAYRAAEAQVKLDHFAGAEKIYRALASWDPQAAEPWVNLGAVAERRGDLEGAVIAYRHAVDIDPRSEMAHYNLAVAYWKRNDWTAVIESLTRVLQINPNNQSARNYLTIAQGKINAH